jgi:hypothetical protein
MTEPQANRPRQYKTWAAWLIVVLLVPLTGASCALVYSLYLHLSSGKLSTLAKSFGPTRATINFAETPVWFSVFFALNAAVAAAFVIGTLVLAKLAYGQLWPRKKTH